MDPSALVVTAIVGSGDVLFSWLHSFVKKWQEKRLVKALNIFKPFQVNLELCGKAEYKPETKRPRGCSQGCKRYIETHFKGSVLQT